MPSLVIVESPAKASTIKGYLGSNYKVVASKGHVRDLPKSTLGVDIDNNFEARYINIRGKGPLIKELKKEAKKASKIYLATDPDREGEAISWHLAVALGIPVEETNRVAFNEITKPAIKAAIKNPRRIDMDLVNSQQTRRILDRIVGYKLSPFLWKTVRSGLSAGRVQSVATRIIVEREEEIRSFVPKEYWTIDALLSKSNGKSFTAKFYGKASKKLELENGEMTADIVNALKGESFKVVSVKNTSRQRHPAPPFTTSTMQQEASKKLGFQSQRIMRVAQELYEGINLGTANGGVQGLITYMRTDSLRISDEAVSGARALISSLYGENYCPASKRVYKSKANAQDAHEAIRPSNPERTPDSIKKWLTSEQYKLYKLIWSRFIASQMASAEIDTVSADIEAAGYGFKATGSTVRFKGFLAAYDYSDDDELKAQTKVKLPELTEGELLSAEDVKGEQHFTDPPARYTEASLIKFLEEKGIGRPSTYTPIITTIIARGYVEREGRALKPTNLGEVTTRIMISAFPDIVNYEFTAQMENDLDSIENGKQTMTDVLGDFYQGFEKSLLSAEEVVAKSDISLEPEQTDLICEKCGSRMVVKAGRYGKFAACPNYPECKNTKPLDKGDKDEKEKKNTAEETDQVCEKCGAPMLRRRGRYGEFLACSKYPTCKNTKQILKELGVKCPKCGAAAVVRYGRNRTVFYSCERYPECDFRSWDQPTEQLCPQCGNVLYLKKGKGQLVCHEKDCGYKCDAPSEVSNTDEKQ